MGIIFLVILHREIKRGIERMEKKGNEGGKKKQSNRITASHSLRIQIHTSQRIPKELL